MAWLPEGEKSEDMFNRPFQ